MAYRKLGVDNKHRRSMLANLTVSLIMNESIETTEARAKEARKIAEKEYFKEFAQLRVDK